MPASHERGEDGGGGGGARKPALCSRQKSRGGGARDGHGAFILIPGGSGEEEPEHPRSGSEPPQCPTAAEKGEGLETNRYQDYF